MALDGRALPGFDNTKHEKYVEKGYCPSVHWTKAYCTLSAGHAGQHAGTYLLEDGTMKVYPLWD